MSEILSAVLGSMHVDMARVERTAMNLANVQTPGYKRELVSAMPFAARLDGPGGPEMPAAPAVHTDMRPGTLRHTGGVLDVALQEGGWFEIATPDGVAHTRQGSFRLDGSGRLVTQQGYPVLGTAGEIQLLHGSPVIDAAGRVFEGGPSAPRDAAPVGQLKIVRFAGVPAMTRLGDGLVRVHGEALAAAEGAGQVRQGYLENSNVVHMQEMVRLMESVRHLETLQKVALAYDDMLGIGIRRLGEP